MTATHPQPWLNRLAKWRVLLTGWQIGTRPKGDPECDAIRDHREATLVLRAEVNALAGLLIGQGVFSADDYIAAIEAAARQLCDDLSQRFPGIVADDDGLHLDPRAAETMRGWKP